MDVKEIGSDGVTGFISLNTGTAVTTVANHLVQ
jgi:hypothetical protein